MPAIRPYLVPGIVLIGVVAAMARSGYQRAVQPLAVREAEVAGLTATTLERIGNARKTIKEIQEQEQAASRARGDVERLLNDLPAGSAMIWLPTLVKAHFAAAGIAVHLVRLNTILDEPDMPGLSRGYWSVALPVDEAGGDVAALLVAVAELEQQNTYLKAMDFSIRPDPEDPRRRAGALNLSALIRK